MDTIRSQQKRWLVHILRHDSLLRITLEGQIQGKAYGRPRIMDWLLKTKEGNISYEELKMSAQDRSRWSQWRWKPAIWQSTTERERDRMIWSWYTGRWWVGCYIWYSKERTGRSRSPPRSLLAARNVTANPSTASVPITVLLYNGPWFCGFNVPVKS